MIRRHAIDINIPLLTNIQVSKLMVEAIERYDLDDLEIKSWDEYTE